MTPKDRGWLAAHPDEAGHELLMHLIELSGVKCDLEDAQIDVATALAGLEPNQLENIQRIVVMLGEWLDGVGREAARQEHQRLPVNLSARRIARDPEHAS